MKVEQTNAGFQPITITLESQGDLDNLICVLQIAYEESRSYSTAEITAETLLNYLRSFDK